MENFDEILGEIGLTKVQSDVYKIILERPGIGIADIAIELNINRSHLYSISRKLMSLELVYDDMDEKLRLYPNNLEKIEVLLWQKKVELNNKYSFFHENIEKFKHTYSEKIHSPKSRIYHGSMGRNEGINRILSKENEGETIYLYTNQETEKEIFSNLEHLEFIRRRLDRNISICVLVVDNEKGRELKTEHKIMRETKILPKNFEFKAEMYVIGNLILNFDLVPDIVGVLIESEEMANIQKNLFRSVWNSLELYL